MSVFACRYCGATVRIERTDSVVALGLIERAVSRVQQTTDRTAAELAIRRLTEELKPLEQAAKELRGERLRLNDYWEHEISTLSRSKPDGERAMSLVSAIVVFALVAGVVHALIHAALPTNSGENVDTLVFLLEIGAATFIVYAIKRHNVRQRAEARAGAVAARDSQLAKLAQEEQALMSSMADIRSRIAKNLRIAND